MFRSLDGPYSHVQSYLKQGKILNVLEQLTEDFNIQATKIIIRDCRAKRGRKVSQRSITVASLLRKYENFGQLQQYITQWLMNFGMKRSRIYADMNHIICKLCAKVGQLHTSSKRYSELTAYEKDLFRWYR